MYLVAFLGVQVAIPLSERLIQQELSYRKQIARKLRTQYVEGICDNPVTLKSRLTVSHVYWKGNHWAGHTRLTISRVIGRWILSWSWNMGQRSLNVIEISAIRKAVCDFLFAFHSNYGDILYRLRDITKSRNFYTHLYLEPPQGIGISWKCFERL